MSPLPHWVRECRQPMQRQLMQRRGPKRGRWLPEYAGAPWTDLLPPRPWYHQRETYQEGETPV